MHVKVTSTQLPQIHPFFCIVACNYAHTSFSAVTEGLCCHFLHDVCSYQRLGAVKRQILLQTPSV